MADIVNLKRVRKQRARLADEAKAQENRARHGLSRVERSVGHALVERDQRRLDGHLRAKNPASGDSKSDDESNASDG